ncbi:hypothetical protein NPIL_101701 [Nephila pilipes]|uniref:Uncharacterized protein n=1 Tax=Nephila pilipes TaxID=299642 RepID=A0A8X6UGV6_NEPPI|nr:hypothetical protein NPIL_101701 [Nephila pilipes]
MNTEQRTTESSFANQVQIGNYWKHIATNSPPENYSETSKKKGFNSKCSGPTLNNETAQCTEDHIENMPSESHASQKKLNNTSSSTQRLETQTRKKSHPCGHRKRIKSHILPVELFFRVQMPIKTVK